MGMAAVFSITTSTIVTRLSLAPRLLSGTGLATVVLLVPLGWIRRVELVFPAWVFVLSTHILIASFRANDPAVSANPGS